MAVWQEGLFAGMMLLTLESSVTSIFLSFVDKIAMR